MHRRRGRWIYGQYHDQFCTRYHVLMVYSIPIERVVSDRGCRVHRFKIRVYPPAILPMLAVYGSFFRQLLSLGHESKRKKFPWRWKRLEILRPQQKFQGYLLTV